MTEISRKLARIREFIPPGGAIRLRGVDWFAWITGGASSVVILTTETGVAEALITRERAFILTNEIERERLALEEITGSEFEIVSSRWSDPNELNTRVQETAQKIFSDRPASGEQPLPRELVVERLKMGPEELVRYRKLSLEASEAMTEALGAAQPVWTEERLAGEGARALWSRGIHPTLVLVANEPRLEKFRHPVATAQKLGGRAMMVFCARRFGLYANLTRFISFREPSARERERFALISEVENTAFEYSRPGVSLADVYHRVSETYARLGMAVEMEKQHIGGLTGYLSREAFARPDAVHWPILENSALAWNPTTAGTKMEDTVLVTAAGLEIMTTDPRWPVETRFGRPRPAVLVKP